MLPDAVTAAADTPAAATSVVDVARSKIDMKFAENAHYSTAKRATPIPQHARFIQRDELWTTVNNGSGALQRFTFAGPVRN